MVEFYDFKIIKSGRVVEVYDYKTKRMVRGYKRRPRASQLKPSKPSYDVRYLDQEQIEQIDVFKYAKELKKTKDEQTQIVCVKNIYPEIFQNGASLLKKPDSPA